MKYFLNNISLAGITIVSDPVSSFNGNIDFFRPLTILSRETLFAVTVWEELLDEADDDDDPLHPPAVC